MPFLWVRGRRIEVTARRPRIALRFDGTVLLPYVDDQPLEGVISTEVVSDQNKTTITIIVDANHVRFEVTDDL